MSRLFNIREDEKGQAIVEFALVLPILIILILGVIEFGWLLNGKITINSAAREGARVAAVLNTTGAERNQKVLDTITSTTDLSGLTIDSSSFEVTEENSYEDNVHNVVVVVNGEMESIIGLFVPNNVSMSSVAKMRRE